MKLSSWRGQVLLFAFTHTNAIYTNALHCEQLCSFYKWEGERGNLILKTGDIYFDFIRYYCQSLWYDNSGIRAKIPF